MQSHKKWFVLLVVLLTSLVLTSAIQGLALAQESSAVKAEATPEVKFDIQPVLVDYLKEMPEGFYGVKPEVALKELSGSAKPFLMDVRDAKEIGEGGYIASAVLIPIRTLTQNLDKLPAQDQPIIVYCSAGHRGGIATQVLHMLGYTNVRSIFGGFNNWKAVKLPVESGMPAEPTVSKAPEPKFDADLFVALDKFVTSLPDDFYAAPPNAVLKSLSAEPKPLLIDVRDEKELKDTGYIEGMVNVPLRTLLDSVDKLPEDKDALIITYCAIGHRGGMAMTTLRLLGYTNVKSLGGGFNNWVKSGLPVVK